MIVYVVDDERPILHNIQMAADKAGIVVELFDRADQVLRRMREQPADILVSDLVMPGTDGYDLLQAAYYEDDTLPDILVLMSAYDRAYMDKVRSLAMESFDVKFCAILEKPARIDEIVSVLVSAKDYYVSQNPVPG
jgi:two-component system nitrogen regulation response regulator GlnG